LPVLGSGAVRTLEISGPAILLSFPLGLVGAVARYRYRNVETVRNIPLRVVLHTDSSSCRSTAFGSTP
jgi:hypothetical protein